MLVSHPLYYSTSSHLPFFFPLQVLAMLKHVTYRSTSSLGRVSSELTCRGSSGVSPDTLSLKGDLSPSPPRAPDTLSLKGEPLGDTISLKDDHHHHHHHLSLKQFPDTISLHSTLSFSSLATGRLSSRCSSTSSLSDTPSVSALDLGGVCLG